MLTDLSSKPSHRPELNIHFGRLYIKFIFSNLLTFFWPARLPILKILKLLTSLTFQTFKRLELALQEKIYR